MINKVCTVQLLVPKNGTITQAVNSKCNNEWMGFIENSSSYYKCSQVPCIIICDTGPLN